MQRCLRPLSLFNLINKIWRFLNFDHFIVISIQGSSLRIKNLLPCLSTPSNGMLDLFEPSSWREIFFRVNNFCLCVALIANHALNFSRLHQLCTQSWISILQHNLFVTQPIHTFLSIIDGIQDISASIAFFHCVNLKTSSIFLG